MIDLDFTAVIQLINFLVTLIVLNILLIRPLRNIIAQRRAKITGFVSDTQALNDKAADILERYNQQLAEAREQSVSAVSDARAKAQKAAEVLTSVAHTGLQNALKTGLEATSKDVAASREALSKLFPQFLQTAYDKLVPNAR